MKLKLLGNELEKYQHGGSVAVVTDTNVAPLYLKEAVDSLSRAGFAVNSVIVKAGEESKDGTTYLVLLERLAKIPLTRTDSVVALGGGMIGDIAGFAAATYMRGIRVVQVPTSLLAAVDSSVGGKTAINLRNGKNMAGAFHAPAFVLRDTSLLDTLPECVFADGCAEVVKTAAIADARLFDTVKTPEGVRQSLGNVIERCVAIKEAIVAEDAFDTGNRQLLNFGHTIGHAAELLSGFAVSHGQAVAKGMAAVTRISEREGWSEPGTADALTEALENHGFDLSIPYSAKEISAAIRKDKKRKSDELDLVIAERIGKCVLRRIRLDEMEWMMS